jgi:hypothetical protein
MTDDSRPPLPHISRAGERAFERDEPRLRDLHKVAKWVNAQPDSIELNVPPEQVRHHLAVEVAAQFSDPRMKFRLEGENEAGLSFVRRYWPWWIVTLCFVLPPVGLLLLLTGKREDRFNVRIEPAVHGSTVYVVRDVHGATGLLAGTFWSAWFPSDWRVPPDGPEQSRPSSPQKAAGSPHSGLPRAHPTCPACGEVAPQPAIRCPKCGEQFF